jgi:hypothetical protein
MECGNYCEGGNYCGSRFQREAAAFFAMAFRFAGDNADARAFPPLLAPSLLNATA